MSREGAKVLKKERLEVFVESLLRDHLVFGPVRKGDVLLLDRIESVRDLVLGRGNTVNSAKGVLFPQTERLFAYRRDETGVTVDGPYAGERDLVLLGVRP